MSPRLLLDTHVVLRWLIDPKRLSRRQLKTLEAARTRWEPVAFSAISLLEIAMLVGDRKVAFNVALDNFFESLQGDPLFQVLPLTYPVATEAGALGVLRDPADRTIVATARVHRLQLVTSDQRIIDSNLVPVVV